MQKDIKLMRCLAVILLYFGLIFSSQAQVTVRTDRTIISEFETISLTITVTGDNEEAPDFSLIRDFTIISQQQRSETSMSISGGKLSLIHI